MTPVALTIAGLDPSGGAGVAADLRAFGAAGAWGAAALSLLTVQTTDGLASVHPIEPALVVAQARAVLDVENVRAVKTGALGSREIVSAVTALLVEHPRLPLVVDPVMVATRSPAGARLADAAALDAQRALIGRAWLVTPNLDEAEALLERRITTREAQREAARELVRSLGARAALVKGGHLEGPRSVDVLATSSELFELSSPRRAGIALHGAGCTLAALIAGRMAKGASTVDAARWAKRRLTLAVGRAARVGGRLHVVDPSLSGPLTAPRPRAS
ncbi:MAG: bifunctional hydroxymethylpyrimidine kinase/phosphomethylpyrimidine kinase [Polyangiaceae bacterium]|nr:bifunctional hydroxymethylpyrimidine kinase/phosphomethylpyrimidine kinase [Polyangiaceae bacterium]